MTKKRHFSYLPDHQSYTSLCKYYKDKSVWIMGGSEGIGASLAKFLTFFGANVLIVSRHQSKLDLAIKQIESVRQSSKQILRSLSLDVTDYLKVNETLNAFVKKNGCMDILINCAGYSHPAFFAETPIKVFHDMMSLNYFGTVNVLKTLVPYMIQKRQGQIMNVSSMAGYLGLFGYSGYCGTKFAVIGLSEALKRELKPYNIYVSVVCPPATQTAGFDKENKSKPEEVFNIEKKTKILSSDKVAFFTLKQLKSHKFLINPSFESRMAYLLNRLAPCILELFVKRRLK